MNKASCLCGLRLIHAVKMIFILPDQVLVLVFCFVILNSLPIFTYLFIGEDVCIWFYNYFSTALVQVEVEKKDSDEEPMEMVVEKQDEPEPEAEADAEETHVGPILADKMAEDLKPMDTDKESLSESKSPEESLQEDCGSDIAPMQTDDQLKQVPQPFVSFFFSSLVWNWRQNQVRIPHKVILTLRACVLRMCLCLGPMRCPCSQQSPSQLRTWACWQSSSTCLTNTDPRPCKCWRSSTGCEPTAAWSAWTVRRKVKRWVNTLMYTHELSWRRESYMWILVHH